MFLKFITYHLDDIVFIYHLWLPITCLSITNAYHLEDQLWTVICGLRFVVILADIFIHSILS